MAVLDTTVFLDLAGKHGRRFKAPAEELVRSLLASGENLATTRINLAELYVGVELSTQPVEEAQAVARYTSWIAVLELDDSAALRYGHIRATLQRHGLLVGDMDILIGAIALANNQPIVTRNAAHFRNMPGLTVLAYG